MRTKYYETFEPLPVAIVAKLVHELALSTLVDARWVLAGRDVILELADPEVSDTLVASLTEFFKTGPHGFNSFRTRDGHLVIEILDQTAFPREEVVLNGHKAGRCEVSDFLDSLNFESNEER